MVGKNCLSFRIFNIFYSLRKSNVFGDARFWFWPNFGQICSFFTQIWRKFAQILGKFTQIVPEFTQILPKFVQISTKIAQFFTQICPNLAKKFTRGCHHIS